MKEQVSTAEKRIGITSAFLFAVGSFAVGSAELTTDGLAPSVAYMPEETEIKDVPDVPGNNRHIPPKHLGKKGII